jgi:hypothetical protein
MIGQPLSLRFEGCDFDADRITQSSGSQAEHSLDYHQGSIVPTPPWYAVNEDQLSRIFSLHQDSDPGRMVRVTTFPTSLLQEFHSLFGPEVPLQREEVARVAGGHGGQKVYAQVASALAQGMFVRGKCELAAEPRGGFCVKSANLLTVTINGRSGLRVGLHVDDLSGLDIGQRASAPSRMCANFGWTDRFFLLVNVSVDDLGCLTAGRLLRRHAGAENKTKNLGRSRPLKDLVDSFLYAHPNRPVVRIRIRPGEAYIAPTENLVHDGSTVGSAIPDVACHVRGMFQT